MSKALNINTAYDESEHLDHTDYRNMYNKLGNKAVAVGVLNENLGIFHDSGQQSMYGGLSVSELKERKGLPATADYPMHMSQLELLANILRMQLTSRRFDKGNIKTQQEAIDTHIHYGTAVRNLLADDDDLMPEDMPVLETTQQVVDRLKGS